MFLFSQFKSILFIIHIFKIMQFEFKNKVLLKMLEKLIIVIINLIIYHLIIKTNNAKFLLIIKFIILDIEYQVSKNRNIINNNMAKLDKKKSFINIFQNNLMIKYSIY